LVLFDGLFFFNLDPDPSFKKKKKIKTPVADVLRSSAYLDMLHDRPRVAAYAKALKIVIENKWKEDKQKNLFVLEIGAGSGLLSALAAKQQQRSEDDDAALLGGVSVVACEQFPPMARLSRRVLRDNGLGEEERVRVLCCRSEDLELVDGEEGEKEKGGGEKSFLLPRKADVVVSEVLDSLLVGEGVLPVMRDVSSRGLMEGNAVAIPSRGRVLVQAVRSRALGLASAAAGYGCGKGGGKCGKGGGLRCPVPLHLDPLYLAGQLVPLGQSAVLFDLDLARPEGKSEGDDGDGVVETSTVEISLGTEEEDEAASSFDALAFWWEVDLAPGVSLSTTPLWAREKREGEKDDDDEGWTDHWRSCWVPVPSCRRRLRQRRGRESQTFFVVRGVLRDTEIEVEVLPEEFDNDKEKNNNDNSPPCLHCSVPSLYSPSGDWGWGTAPGTPAALLLEEGAKAVVARAEAEAAKAAKEEEGEGEEEEGEAASTVLVLGDGHGAAVATAAAAASSAASGEKVSKNVRVLALQPSCAGCLAVESFAAAAAAAAAGRVEARLLSEFLSSSSSPSHPLPVPAVALLAEPHYRTAEASNLPWRLLDFWPRRDELVDRGLLLPPSSSSSSSVTSPAGASVVAVAISCPLLSRNFGGELREVEGVSMRCVDEAFRRGIGDEGGGGGGGEGGEEHKSGKAKGARALFARALSWQCGGGREVSARAELLRFDISRRRASQVLPASEEVELELLEEVCGGGEKEEKEEEVAVHGVACWLRFEAAANSSSTAATKADFWAPGRSGAPSPGSQAILLFHEPWLWRKSEKKKKETLKVRVTLRLAEDGSRVDGEVVAVVT
jgi:hypothetical protein